MPQGELPSRRAWTRLVDLGDELGAAARARQPHALLEQLPADAATPMVGVHGDVDDRDDRVVLRRQDHAQCSDDVVIEQRSPVRPVPRSPGAHQLAAQSHVVARGSRRFLGTVHPLSGGPDLAPGREAVVVRAEFHEPRRGRGHGSFLPAAATGFRRVRTTGHR